MHYNLKTKHYGLQTMLGSPLDGRVFVFTDESDAMFSVCEKSLSQV